MGVKQVWQTSDGAVFYTAEDAKKYDDTTVKRRELDRAFNGNCQSFGEYVTTHWEEIKKVMEG